MSSAINQFVEMGGNPLSEPASKSTLQEGKHEWKSPKPRNSSAAKRPRAIFGEGLAKRGKLMQQSSSSSSTITYQVATRGSSIDNGPPNHLNLKEIVDGIRPVQKASTAEEVRVDFGRGSEQVTVARIEARTPAEGRAGDVYLRAVDFSAVEEAYPEAYVCDRGVERAAQEIESQDLLVYPIREEEVDKATKELREEGRRVYPRLIASRIKSARIEKLHAAIEAKEEEQRKKLAIMEFEARETKQKVLKEIVDQAEKIALEKASEEYPGIRVSYFQAGYLSRKLSRKQAYQYMSDRFLQNGVWSNSVTLPTSEITTFRSMATKVSNRVDINLYCGPDQFLAQN